MLWPDERIQEMSHSGNEWITIADAMREEYEAKIAELTGERDALWMVVREKNEYIAGLEFLRDAWNTIEERNKALSKKAQSYDDLLSVVYGQNLMVHGWHLNGEPEPLDSFIDNNRHE